MISRIVTAVFGVRPGLIFGIVIAVVVVGGGFYFFFWRNPEKWNPAARRYLAHLGTLQRDSVTMRDKYGNLFTAYSLRGDTLSGARQALQGAESDKQTAKDDARRALSDLNQQVFKSDRLQANLTDAQRQAEYYRLLNENGTLKTLADTNSQSAITSAGLSTATREKLQRERIEALQLSEATYAAETARAKREKENAVEAKNRATESSLYAEGKLLKYSRPRPLKEWFKSRKEEAGRDADSVRIKREGKPVPGVPSINDESEIEKIENRPRP